VEMAGFSYEELGSIRRIILDATECYYPGLKKGAISTNLGYLRDFILKSA
jgi:hypothetical protein